VELTDVADGRVDVSVDVWDLHPFHVSEKNGNLQDEDDKCLHEWVPARSHINETMTYVRMSRWLRALSQKNENLQDKDNLCCPVSTAMVTVHVWSRGGMDRSGTLVLGQRRRRRRTRGTSNMADCWRRANCIVSTESQKPCNLKEHRKGRWPRACHNCCTWP
jgi:hypothetical protein